MPPHPASKPHRHDALTSACFVARPFQVDLGALLAVPSRPQRVVHNTSGAFDLFRVGDAVSSRNVHAALYDSLRLCKDL
eukprot:7020045-Prymnesium_polylepis.1